MEGNQWPSAFCGESGIELHCIAHDIRWMLVIIGHRPAERLRDYMVLCVFGVGLGAHDVFRVVTAAQEFQHSLLRTKVQKLLFSRPL